jgi:hypothetical protein
MWPCNAATLPYTGSDAVRIQPGPDLDGQCRENRANELVSAFLHVEETMWLIASPTKEKKEVELKGCA